MSKCYFFVIFGQTQLLKPVSTENKEFPLIKSKISFKPTLLSGSLAE